MKRPLLKLRLVLTIAIFLFGFVFTTLATASAVAFTPFSWLVFAYLAWIYLIDGDVCERGGRRIRLIRDLPLWDAVADYFSLRLERVPGCDLDPARSYLFACFPHGVLPFGISSSFMVRRCFREQFPSHEPYLLVLKCLFLWPVYRDYILALGMVAASSRSLRWILGGGGGRIACLMVGGAREAFNCRPGDCRLVLKKRKGFARLALECGSPLVPVFTFGETQLYDQLGGEGSLLRRLQVCLKRLTGVAMVVPIGCGFFQDHFGLIPRQKRLTVLVGKPIPVEKVEDPTQEQVDGLHARFVEEIVELFQSNKHKYLEDADGVGIVIE